MRRRYPPQFNAAHTAPITVLDMPGPRGLDGIIQAAALVALADGEVSACERGAVIGFLRRHALIVRYGLRPTLLAFDRAVTYPPHRELAELCRATESLRPLAGSQAANLVLGVARQVMLADGTAQPEEMILLRSIQEQLSFAGPGDASAVIPQHAGTL